MPDHKVRFVASDPFGGGNLRSFWPAEALNAVEGYRCFARVGFPVVTDPYDTIVIHRPISRDAPVYVKKFQDLGWRVLIDEDDDLTRVSETKNRIAEREWGPDAQWSHEVSMQMADGVTVSTEKLAEVYAPHNDNIFVCQNYLPRDYGGIATYKMPKDTSVRVGWAGITDTHLHDLEWIAPVFNTMMYGANYLNIGDPATMNVLGYNGPVEHHSFQAGPEALYKLMSRADIGIVPLSRIEFNEAKSYLKAMEFMFVGVPVVAADFPEQRRLIEHGVDGFLATEPAEFASYVQQLVNDPILREEMGKKARSKARHFCVEDHADEWVKAVG